MEDRVRVMKQIQSERSTHSCPECSKPAYCAMEAGKSANLCWCMGVEKDENPSSPASGDSCLCEECLTNNKTLHLVKS